MNSDGEESVGPKWLVMDGLVSTAGCARSNIVHDELNEAGPVELPSNVSDSLTNTWMSCQMMVVMGTKDIKSDVLVGGNVYRPFVQEELIVFGQHPCITRRPRGVR